MPVTKIKSKWSSGNLVFTDSDGTELLSIESDGTIDIKVAGKFTLGGVAVTKTAAEINNLVGLPAVADPGDAGAIPVTGGYVPLVTEGAETRTLAAPTAIGTLLLLYMKTDGGNGVVTCATTFNETGNNTLTFANTGEACLLISVEEGGNKRWRSIFIDGCALSTV